MAIELLAPAESHLDLDQGALQIDLQGDQGVSLFRDLSHELVDLAAVHQKLPGP